MLIQERLKKELREDGRTIKWWASKYLGNVKYSTIISQINGFNPLCEAVKKAIEKYLEG